MIWIGLVVSVLGILGGAILAAWALYHANEGGRVVSRFDELIADVRVADAETTDLARVYALTGDAVWRNRHDIMHVRLVDLHEAMAGFVRTPAAEVAVQRAAYAADRREVIEAQAFAARAAGADAQAAALVLSGEYALYQDLSARSLAEATQAVRRDLAADLQTALVALLAALFVLVSATLTLCIVFLRLHQIMSRQTDELRAAGLAITSHATTLEDRIRARTADLETAKQAAEAAARAKGEFLAAMSHEVRTPLNSILGLASVLEGRTLALPDAELVVQIRTSGESLLELLDDILDLTRLDAGVLTLEAAPFEPGEAVRACARVFAPKAGQKGLFFDVDTASLADMTLCGDASRLRQILAALLSNAVKFTDVGAVRVSAHAFALADDRVELAVTVEDTGCGIGEEQRARLFQRFVQADGSTTRRFGGAGLGLALAHELAACMGGAIEVESAPGLGSTFRFIVTLPRAAARTAPAPAGEIVLPPDLQILVAEDNPQNRLVVKLLLEKAGLTPVFAEDGEIAVELWRAQRFDAVLMDLQMPNLSGLEAAARIRAEEAESGRPRTPIIALTANAMPEDVKACLAAGMDRHVSKPVRPQALVAALADTLAAARKAA